MRLKTLRDKASESPIEEYDMGSWKTTPLGKFLPGEMDLIGGAPHLNGKISYNLICDYYGISEEDALSLFSSFRYKNKIATKREFLARIDKLIKEME